VAVREPRAMLQEFAMRLPEDVEVRVWDSRRKCPTRPTKRLAETDGMTTEQLAALVARDEERYLGQTNRVWSAVVTLEQSRSR